MEIYKLNRLNKTKLKRDTHKMGKLITEGKTGWGKSRNRQRNTTESKRGEIQEGEQQSPWGEAVQRWEA